MHDLLKVTINGTAFDEMCELWEKNPLADNDCDNARAAAVDAIDRGFTWRKVGKHGRLYTVEMTRESACLVAQELYEVAYPYREPEGPEYTAHYRAIQNAAISLAKQVGYALILDKYHRP